ncbi:MAG TPA: hypothetical protein VIH99_00565 [Bdellovibrionota bacterium]|jgi:predicted hotdog family 3-hydroxylacyl-ACP dehydratase
MNLREQPVPTSDLGDYLPHRAPMVWVDEILEVNQSTNGPQGICRVVLGHDRAFHAADGSPRASTVVEWIAQAYGYVKAFHRRAGGFGVAGFGRAILVGISDCEADLSGIEEEQSLLVHVREMRNLHPAYVLEGSVTNEAGSRVYGKARLQVFGGAELPEAVPGKNAATRPIQAI